MGVEDAVERLVAGLAGVHARRALAAGRCAAVDHAAGQRIRAAVLEDQAQRGVLGVDRSLALARPVAPVRVAAHAVVDRGDLDRVHVDVVAVAAERLGGPHDREVAVQIGAERLLLISLVSVAQHDQVEALRGGPGDLDRPDHRVGQGGRSGGDGSGDQQDGGEQRSHSPRRYP
jgi:hypothetical protein